MRLGETIIWATEQCAVRLSHCVLAAPREVCSPCAQACAHCGMRCLAGPHRMRPRDLARDAQGLGYRVSVIKYHSMIWYSVS
jgi:hypothetical protein